MNDDPRRSTPRTDHVLADPRLRAAVRGDPVVGLLALGVAFFLEEDGTGRRRLAFCGLFAIGAATRLACLARSWREGRRRLGGRLSVRRGG